MNFFHPCFIRSFKHLRINQDVGRNVNHRGRSNHCSTGSIGCAQMDMLHAFHGAPAVSTVSQVTSNVFNSGIHDDRIFPVQSGTHRGALIEQAEQEIAANQSAGSGDQYFCVFE